MFSQFVNVLKILMRRSYFLFHPFFTPFWELGEMRAGENGKRCFIIQFKFSKVAKQLVEHTSYFLYRDCFQWLD